MSLAGPMTKNYVDCIIKNSQKELRDNSEDEISLDDESAMNKADLDQVSKMFRAHAKLVS